MSKATRSQRNGLLVAEANWQEVQAALGAGATAVLPVGAAAKQHGLHLPMNTDFVQAEWLAKQLAATTFVVVWPTLSYGHYPAFVDYPGSCTLSRATFEALNTELIDNVLRAGARALVILNTGISTIKSLRAALEKSSEPPRVKLANVYEGSNYRAAEAKIGQQIRGGHADELETSIMLALAPDIVRMHLAQACTREMTRGPFNRADPNGPNYSPSGVYGDPRLASKEKGEVLLQGMLSDLLALLR